QWTSAAAKRGAKGTNRTGRNGPGFNARRKELLKRFDKQPFELAWVVFNTAAEEPKPTPERLRAWNGLLAGLPPKDRPRYAELLYLQRVVKWSATIKTNWPAQLVHNGLEAARAAASAHALQPEIASWVEDIGREADRARDEADKALFGGDPTRWSEAETRFNDANSLYAKIQHHAEIVEDVRCRMQDAFGLLPAALPAIENDRTAWEDWKAAAQAARELQALLRDKSSGSARDEAVIKMESRAGPLRSRLPNSLASPLGPDRIKPLVDPPARERAGAVRDIEALLRRPWLSVAERAKLWQTGRTLAAALN